MSKPSDLSRAVERLMHELDQAICEDRAHAAIWDADTAQSMNFFHVAFNALSNDSVAHAIKVLDRNSQTASFWYVFRHEEQEIRSFCTSRSISLPDIEVMSDRLKEIRDRTHFHIDRRDVFDPEDVWRRAKVRHSDFTAILNSLWLILDHLYIAEHGESFGSLDYYTGTDVGPILRAVKNAGVAEIVFRNAP